MSSAVLGDFDQNRDLRHVACCNMLDAGLAVEEVARIMGHRSTAMVTTAHGHRIKVITRQRQADLISAGMARILGSKAGAA